MKSSGGCNANQSMSARMVRRQADRVLLTVIARSGRLVPSKALALALVLSCGVWTEPDARLGACYVG